MTTNTLPRLLYHGNEIGASADRFGLLQASDDIREDGDALRARMGEHGHVFLRGVLERDRVLAARESVLLKLKEEGALAPDAPLMDGIAAPGVEMSFRPELTIDSAPIQSLLYDGAMMELLETLLGESVRHFDYTWLRAKSPGPKTATHPHCDVVYMGRGTRDRLFTAWTPLGDVPWELGGLMILENSHRREDKLGKYWEMDVDTYCENGPEAEEIELGKRSWETTKQGGAFDYDAHAVRDKLGGRWLGSEYRAGDVLLFGMHTLHASLDNQTNRFRLSTDSRYQPASEPADERWIGPSPSAHGPKSKIGMIC